MGENIYKEMDTCKVLKETIFKELIEYGTYESLGTLNWVVDQLQTLKQRILLGEKIKLEKTGEVLTIDSFYKLVEDNFVGYVFKNLKNDL